jgi:8-oxo-dGTP diphosphatase
MIPRFGETVRRNKNYRLRPGVYAVLRDGGDLLLTVQFADIPDIQLPGGGIDPGESPIPALHREIREETGWKVQIEHRLGAFRRFTYMPDYGFWAEKVCHVYLGRPVLQVAQPSEPDHMALFMPLSDAMDRLGNEGDRSFVKRLFGVAG